MKSKTDTTWLSRIPEQILHRSQKFDKMMPTVAENTLNQIRYDAMATGGAVRNPIQVQMEFQCQAHLKRSMPNVFK